MQLFPPSLLCQIAVKFGTPVYVYAKQKIVDNFLAYQTALQDRKNLVCYAVKANSNLSILKILADLGCGFDVVSLGELKKVIWAGGDCRKVVFSGVGKQVAEIKFALENKIKCFNVESKSELDRIESVSKSMQTIAPISIRINPNINAKTHPYISTGLKENKFGVELDVALELYKYAANSSNLIPIGLDCHIGSQINAIEPYFETIDTMLDLLSQLREMGISLSHLDLGGGKGIAERGEKLMSIGQWVQQIMEHRGEMLTDLEIILEPGRSIVAEAGVLLTSVQYLKSTSEKNFAIVDAAMNDLIRPSLYQAEMQVEVIGDEVRNGEKIWDIVGPICESADFLAKDCRLALTESSLLAIKDVGAYGFSMASNYNQRPLAAEVMIDSAYTDGFRLIRKRQNYQNLINDELPLLEAD